MRSRPSLEIPPEVIFDAIFGIAYAVDRDGTILRFSRGPFLEEERNGVLAPWEPEKAVGTNLFSHVHGDEVRDAFRALHDAVWKGRRQAVGFDYRCDAPDLERRMHMSLSLLRGAQAPVAVLYQSIVLSETPRVPMPLFAADKLTGRGEAPLGRPIVRLCSYCQKVCLPQEKGSFGEPEWMEPADYYRRGGGTEISVSHAVCKDCFERVVKPSLQAKAATGQFGGLRGRDKCDRAVGLSNDLD